MIDTTLIYLGDPALFRDWIMQQSKRYETIGELVEDLNQNGR